MLEAISDALRREVAPLGVSVVAIEPGGVRTEMAERLVALLTRRSRVLPDRMLDRILAAGLRPHYPRTTTAGG